MSQAFAQLYEFEDTEKRRREQAAADRATREAAIAAKQQTILVDWLRQTMTNLGIAAEVTTTSVLVEGLRFTIRTSYDSTEPYPLRGSIHNAMIANSLDEVEPVEYGNARFDLVIENTLIGEEYRARRPDMNCPFSEYQETIRVMKTASVEFPLAVAGAIKKLLKSAEDAALNKATIEAKWMERQEELKAAREAEQAEHERSAREWQERHQREEAERIAARKAREAKELALRTEVANKFGVNVEAYDYLIESLVDEITRRRNALVEYEFE